MKFIPITRFAICSSEQLWVNVLLKVLLPIVIGVLIYAGWRGVWFIDPQGRFFPLFTKAVPAWLLYNLPDALYAVSLYNTFYLIWKQQYLWWCIALWCVLCLAEALQAVDVVKGTYDTVDLLAYTLPLLYIIYKHPPLSKSQNLTHEKSSLSSGTYPL